MKNRMFEFEPKKGSTQYFVCTTEPEYAVYSGFSLKKRPIADIQRDKDNKT